MYDCIWFGGLNTSFHARSRLSRSFSSHTHTNPQHIPNDGLPIATTNSTLPQLRNAFWVHGQHKTSIHAMQSIEMELIFITSMVDVLMGFIEFGKRANMNGLQVNFTLPAS